MYIYIYISQFPTKYFFYNNFYNVTSRKIKRLSSFKRCSSRDVQREREREKNRRVRITCRASSSQSEVRVMFVLDPLKSAAKLGDFFTSLNSTCSVKCSSVIRYCTVKKAVEKMERLEDFSVRFSHVSVYRFPG